MQQADGSVSYRLFLMTQNGLLQIFPGLVATQFFNVSAAGLQLFCVRMHRIPKMGGKMSAQQFFSSWTQPTDLIAWILRPTNVQVGFPSSVLVITWRSTELAIFENGWPSSIRDPLLVTWRNHFCEEINWKKGWKRSHESFPRNQKRCIL